jgi:hypothetical protein
MSKIKVTNFTISLDGFGAGTNQSMKEPLGIGGEELHTWMFPTKRFRAMSGKNDGTEGLDNDFVEKALMPLLVCSFEMSGSVPTIEMKILSVLIVGIHNKTF